MLLPDSRKPKITAAFPREGYRPGVPARLVFYSKARAVQVQFLRAGLEGRQTIPSDIMLGKPVGPKRWIGRVRPGRVVRLRIGHRPSGVYFAQLTASGSRVGYAPFVLRPSRLGEHRVAVVMPTMTWQAYNFRDDDGNGSPDTWYAGGPSARLGRPFRNRGLPAYYKYYDAPFLRWLAESGHDVDYLSDADLRHVPSAQLLARRYTLMIFPGHHEYVTQHEFDAVRGFRNRGGNLMFLSANNFFWKTVIHGNVMRRIVHWRDIGYPEADLTGVRYFHNDLGQHRGKWFVRRAMPWLFAGTGLTRGSRFSSGGIEADHVYQTSPSNVQVVAEIPNLYGPGMTAQMTYYERRGAKVFAAGSFTLAGSALEPYVKPILENLWDRLATDNDTDR
jgi:N,N-dimethylformamidase beta subunit-like, C-terminal